MDTNFLSTFLIGPLAALLPEQWRKMLPVAGFVQWDHAGTVSGILECLGAIVGLAYWYLHEMTRIVSGGMDLAVTGKLAAPVTEQQIGGSALFVFISQPLTWLLLYFFIEGAVRFGAAAFTEAVFGTLPLSLLERSIYLVRNRKEVKPGEVLRNNAKSYFGSIRERLLFARQKEVPDQLHHQGGAPEEMLEIWSSRRKVDWEPPKTVRVDDLYYRLEEIAVEKGSRPFRYRLRRLSAGVPSRTMLLYSTADAAINKEG